MDKRGKGVTKEVKRGMFAEHSRIQNAALPTLAQSSWNCQLSPNREDRSFYQAGGLFSHKAEAMKAILRDAIEQRWFVEAYRDEDTEKFEVGWFIDVSSEWYAMLTINKAGRLDTTLVGELESLHLVSIQSAYLDRLRHHVTMLDLEAEIERRFLPADLNGAIAKCIADQRVVRLIREPDPIAGILRAVEGSVLCLGAHCPISATFDESYMPVDSVRGLEAYGDYLESLEALLQ